MLCVGVYSVCMLCMGVYCVCTSMSAHSVCECVCMSWCGLGCMVVVYVCSGVQVCAGALSLGPTGEAPAEG